MVPQELQKMFGIKDAKDLGMANNIWKMLDDMAESNPDNYKQFISKHINEGVKDAKEKKQERDKPYQIKPHPVFKIQMDAILAQQVLQKQPQMHQKLNFSAPKWSETLKNLEKQIRLHLNICHSERVRLPTLRTSKQQIKDITLSQLTQIQNFYYSLQGPLKELQKGESQKVPNYSYTIILNSYTYQSIIRQGGRKVLMGLVLSYFQERLRTDRNLLKGQIDVMGSGKNAYYKLDSVTVEVSQEKFWWGGKGEVPEFVMEKEVDIKRLENTTKQSNDANQYAKEKPNEKKQQKKTMPDIKFKRDDPPEDQSPSFLKKPQQQKPKKKFVVQVLKETITQQEVQTKPSGQIPFQMKETQNGYSFEFQLPGIQSIVELDLEVCRNVIRLSTKDCRKVELKLLKAIDQEKVKAKMKKKKNILLVDTVFK